MLWRGLPGFDNEGGLDLYYYGARYYDPVLGRFMAVDPLASKYPGLSPYVYCANNPLKFVDPDGLATDHFMCDRDNGVKPEHIAAAADFVANNADEATFWGGLACYLTAGVAAAYGLEPLALGLAGVGTRLLTTSAVATVGEGIVNPTEQNKGKAYYTGMHEFSWMVVIHVLEISKGRNVAAYVLVDIGNNLVCYYIVSPMPEDQNNQQDSNQSSNTNSSTEIGNAQGGENTDGDDPSQVAGGGRIKAPSNSHRYDDD